MKRIASVALIVSVLAGCTPAQQEVANAVIPAVVSGVEIALPGATPILTAAQALACQVQADANTLPPSPTQSKISTSAGMACTW